MGSQQHTNGSTGQTISGAITYPSRNASSAQSFPIQPRQPRNLQGLLRFAMEATKAEDAPGNSEFGPMDEERRKFLEEALKSLTVDVVEVLQNAIKVLTNSEKMRDIQLGQTVPEDVKTSFTNVLEFVDDIDLANDFYKLGGFAIFPICYSSENEEVRAYASKVLAELCQNNSFCQAKALECGLLNILLTLVELERGNALVKCLYAISCMCREYEPSCREFLAQGGCAMLAQLLRGPERAAHTKVAFLVRYFISHYSEAKQQFIEQNIIRTIAEQINAGRDSTTEYLLSTLLALVEEEDPTVLQQCRDPSVGLKKILEDHMKHPDLEGDRFNEEKEYCQEILKRVFEDCPEIEVVENEDADR